MADTSSQLEELRSAIDAIDGEILRLFTERARLVLSVGEVKRITGRRVYDPDREKLILDRLAAAAKPPLDPAAVRRLFERIIDESRALEQRHSDAPPR